MIQSRLTTRTRRFVAAAGLAVAVAGASMTGCEESDTSAPTWGPVNAVTVNEKQKTQMSDAAAARDEMFQSLVRTLTSEMAEHGPAAAISVCRDKAPAIAKEVSASRGVKIGRTSWKLRNPSNVPPGWAGTLIADKPEEPQYVCSTDGHLGALLPIRVSGLCLMCHGGPDEVSEEVKAQLAQHYPQDQATGFRDGDLRGWFWVEIPPDKPE